jgi:hypothetical protein
MGLVAAETVVFLSYDGSIGSSLTVVIYATRIAVTVQTNIVVYIPTYLQTNYAVVIRLPTSPDAATAGASNGLIIGVVSGVALVAVLIVGAVIFVVRRKNSDGRSLSSEEATIQIRLDTINDDDPDQVAETDEDAGDDGDATTRFGSDDITAVQSLDPSLGSLSPGVWI